MMVVVGRDQGALPARRNDGSLACGGGEPKIVWPEENGKGKVT
jgi:hypothetical protein